MALEWLGRLWATATALAALAWLRLNRWLVQVALRRGPRDRRLWHGVAVVGDGVAMGFGEPGVVGRNAGPAGLLERKLFADARLRHRWEVFNLGHWGATSEEWLPSWAARPVALGSGVRETLWRDARASPLLEQAEVVVLHVGAMDRFWAPASSAAPEAVADNAFKLAARLRCLGKEVVVCPPVVGPGSSPAAQAAAAPLADALAAAFAARFRPDLVQDPGLVLMADPNGLLGKRAEFYFAADGVHLNARGYKILAHQVWAAVADLCVRREWEVNRAVIAAQAPGQAPAQASAEHVASAGLKSD